jgi:signal recognition particle subunit SRP54
MADMMKMMGGKKGGMMKQMMGGLAGKMGLGGLGGGMGGMPDLSKMDPKQLEALAKQAEAAGIKPGSLPGLGGGGLRLPGLGGGLPGLPGLPKKK